jgi:hypothetical protein
MDEKIEFKSYLFYGALALGSAYLLWKSKMVRQIASPIVTVLLSVFLEQRMKDRTSGGFDVH